MDIGAFVGLGLLVLAGLALIWRARLALTVFVVRIGEGRVDYVKGRMPQRLLDEVAEVARKEQVKALIVTCRIESQAPQLSFKGHSNAGLEQILRNLVGQYPLTRLRQAPRVRGRG